MEIAAAEPRLFHGIRRQKPIPECGSSIQSSNQARQVERLFESDRHNPRRLCWKGNGKVLGKIRISPGLGAREKSADGDEPQGVTLLRRWRFTGLLSYSVRLRCRKEETWSGGSFSHDSHSWPACLFLDGVR